MALWSMILEDLLRISAKGSFQRAEFDAQNKQQLPAPSRYYLMMALWTGADRAAAAAGQGGLMSLYDSLFHMMDMQAAQVLVTSKEFSDPVFRENLSITVEDLLAANVVPVFNENDAISSRPQNDVRFHPLS